MPSPIEGSEFSVGEKRTLSFVNKFNTSGLNMTGKFENLTTGNNTQFNNSQITITNNDIGSLSISSNFAEAGEYLAQFRGASANNTNIYYGPVFSFRVQTPL